MSYLQRLHGFFDTRRVPCLAFLGFVEATFLPIPTCLLLVPLCISKPNTATRYASIALAFSSLGSVYGYTIGHFGQIYFGSSFTALISSDWYVSMIDTVGTNGLSVLLIMSILPIPFQLVAISAGVSSVGIFPFLIVSAVGRAVQFYSLSKITSSSMRIFGAKENHK